MTEAWEIKMVSILNREYDKRGEQIKSLAYRIQGLKFEIRQLTKKLEANYNER